jgi:sRNA-binding carbon storage regulator CsrA
MLFIEIKPGETITIGTDIKIRLEEKSGQVARLAFDADRSVPIRKQERDPSAAIAAKSGLNGAFA